MAWSNQSTRHNAWELFGIPIHIDRSWFVIFTFMTWSLGSSYFPVRYPGLAAHVYAGMGGAAALLLFLCVLLHELGHSLVAKAYGIPVLRVTLFIFGGVAQIATDPRRPAVELMIALAGPLVSGLLAGGCFAASQVLFLQSPLRLVTTALLGYLTTINLGILFFNLLPGFPLDGGRMLRALLWAGTGSLRRATRIASILGAVLGVGLLALGVWGAITGAWGVGLWYLLLGFFLRNAALASYRRAG